MAQVIIDDPRPFYYPFMLMLAAVIGCLIPQALPTELILNGLFCGLFCLNFVWLQAFDVPLVKFQ